MPVAIGTKLSAETRAKMSRAQQLRRMRRPPATAIKVGDMVVCPDGSVGLLSELYTVGGWTCLVQFGASGPFRRYSWKGNYALCGHAGGIGN